MKRLFILALVACFTLSVGLGCGGKDTKKDTKAATSEKKTEEEKKGDE